MDLITQSIFIYAMAIFVSLVVALLINGVVVALPLLERASAPAPEPAAAEPEPEPDDGLIPGEHVAAISAAIAAIVSARHILHIEDRGRGAVWTAEGRMMHHTSHSISRRPQR